MHIIDIYWKGSTWWIWAKIWNSGDRGLDHLISTKWDSVSHRWFWPMQGLNCSTHARSTSGSYSAGVDKLQMLWVCPKMWWRQIQPNLGVEFATGNCGLGVSLFLGSAKAAWAQPIKTQRFSPPTLGTFATMDGRAPGAVFFFLRKLQGFDRS